MQHTAGIVKLTGWVSASECTSLVPCLPALEAVKLELYGPLVRDSLGCLLEALAGCPCLRALDLSSERSDTDVHHKDLDWPFPDAAAFAKLRSLTKLALSFDGEDGFALADVVSALMPLTGLAELSLGSCRGNDVPAALGQITSLRSLTLYDFRPCVLEAGCLELPNLLSLHFDSCDFPKHAQVLPGVTRLQRLTRMVFSYGQRPFFFDTQLVQLPRLQHLVFSPDLPWDARYSGEVPGPFRLPADMGLLRSSLLHFDISGLKLLHFPLVLTQLAALQFLDASNNEFAQLPAAITALSRLTELRLGRVMCTKDPLQLRETRRLDVRALGDLSGFPALRELTFNFCEVMLCNSMLGAVRHGRLTSLCFCNAHPAPECALGVLQLSQELWCWGRGSVVKHVNVRETCIYGALQAARGRAPCQKFMAALEECEPESEPEFEL